LDGKEEIRIANDTYHVFIEPETASIREFDLLQAEENMLDVLDPEGQLHGLFRDRWHGQVVDYTLTKRTGKPMELVFNSKGAPLLEKVFTFEPGFLGVGYKFLKEGELVLEVPLNIWDPNAAITVGNKALPLSEEAQVPDVEDLHWDVGTEHIDLIFSGKVSVNLEPIHMVHESELFKEVTYQGTIVEVKFNTREGEEFNAKLYVCKKTERG